VIALFVVLIGFITFYGVLRSAAQGAVLVEKGTSS